MNVSGAFRTRFKTVVTLFPRMEICRVTRTARMITRPVLISMLSEMADSVGHHWYDGELDDAFTVRWPKYWLDVTFEQADNVVQMVLVEEDSMRFRTEANLN